MVRHWEEAVLRLELAKAYTNGAIAGNGLLSLGWVMAIVVGTIAAMRRRFVWVDEDRQPARLADSRLPIVDTNDNERASNISVAAMVAGAAR